MQKRGKEFKRKKEVRRFFEMCVVCVEVFHTVKVGPYPPPLPRIPIVVECPTTIYLGIVYVNPNYGSLGHLIHDRLEGSVAIEFSLGFGSFYNTKKGVVKTLKRFWTSCVVNF